ncbi:hypothetical protein [Nocardia sp. NPDC052112]|uniref:maltokinase N-terminal cap-like domain-containing protein n=1 Tax=Nocardia sp. NPDC052112 TaxID=3155646 RepID=UPI003440371C
MAVIHRTTMSPGKLELLTAWLPTRPWYRDNGRAPELSRAGGFRLDDPAGAVGIEFVLVNDSAGPEPITYHVPLTYRGAPLDGREDALVGTSIHGVLGQRWIYDATWDPVAVAQIIALLAGQAQPQAQSASDTPDLSVVVSVGEALSAATEFRSALDTPTHTDIAVSGGRSVRVERVLYPEPTAPNSTAAPLGPASGSPHSEASVAAPDSGTAGQKSAAGSRPRAGQAPKTPSNSTHAEDQRSAAAAFDATGGTRVTAPWQTDNGSTVRGMVLAIGA